jgi:hypothetical protein
VLRRTLLIALALALPLLGTGCPPDDDDSADDDDSGPNLPRIEDVFELAAGLRVLECSNVSGADPAGAFSVGNSYGIDVDPETLTLSFAANGGVQLTRTWDGVDDGFEGDPETSDQVTIEVIDEDGGKAQVVWDRGFNRVITARWTLAGGIVFYSFIASDL